MRKCPFCGAEVKFVYPHLIQFDDGKWGFFHHCDEKLGIVISASTPQEVIDKWNGEIDV